MALSRPVRASEPDPLEDAVNLELLLLGKTGSGKSSTGNSILFKSDFLVSHSSTSTTSTTKTCCTNYEAKNGKRYRINVTDGPGLKDTSLTRLQDEEQARKNIEKTLTECRFGIHAFLFIVRMSVRFTTEDRETVDDLKRILGPDFLKTHAVVVVAGGDHLKEENEHLTFDQWCHDQKGDLKILFQECNNRCVLFDNKADPMFYGWKRRDQLETLLENIDIILRQNNGNSYNSTFFQNFNKEHQRLAYECGYEFVKQEFRTALCELQGTFRRINDKAGTEQAIVALEVFVRKVEHECNRTDKVEKFRNDLVDLAALLNDLLAASDPKTPQFEDLVQKAKEKLDSIDESTIPLDGNLCTQLMRWFSRQPEYW